MTKKQDKEWDENRLNAEYFQEFDKFIAEDYMYGCVIKDSDDDLILFPATKYGQILNGTGISNQEGAAFALDVTKDTMAIVRCIFVEQDTKAIIPPDEASERNFQNMGFNIDYMTRVTVSGLMGKLDNLWAVYEESPEEFRSMLIGCIEDYLETLDEEKTYLGFAFSEPDEEKNSMYVMSKIGRLYPKFKFSTKKDILFEHDEGSVFKVQFRDGTLPLTLKQANKLSTTESESVFLAVSYLGGIKLKEDFNYTTWVEALEDDEMQELMKYSMLALQRAHALDEQNKQAEKQSNKEQDL